MQAGPTMALPMLLKKTPQPHPDFYSVAMPFRKPAAMETCADLARSAFINAFAVQAWGMSATALPRFCEQQEKKFAAGLRI
jgi:hypothetical protein